MTTITNLAELTQAWFDFLDEIGGVDNLNKHPVRRDELRRLVKVWMDAYANPPEDVIGVVGCSPTTDQSERLRAITYAEQCLIQEQMK